jgi:hypothetical protein
VIVFAVLWSLSPCICYTKYGDKLLHGREFSEKLPSIDSVNRGKKRPLHGNAIDYVVNNDFVINPESSSLAVNRAFA